MYGGDSGNYGVDMATIKGIILIILDILLAFLIRNKKDIIKVLRFPKKRKKWVNKPKIKLFKKSKED